MSFLQPALLAALPLIALPIIIHLINQRRYQTLDWAAMQFLLAANRMSRGYARIRQWLILALRTLAIAALIFAAARPLAGGLLGLAAGGRADAILILLDRSPSMQQKAGGVAKLQQAQSQLVGALDALPASRLVLIESGGMTPHELTSPEALLESPHATGIAAPADLPAMLQVAHDYVKDNQLGRTEVWIVSDLAANDWNADSGRWKSLRDAFLEFPQEIRFHLLGYESPADENLAVRVADVHRESLGERAELAMTVIVEDLARGSSAPADGVRQVPLRFEIDGARSETTVELAGVRTELKNHRIPLGGKQQRGWGRVSIPTDGNPADDQFYFVFDEPPQRKTAIVTDQPLEVRPLALAAEISSDRSQLAAAEVYEPGQLATLPWEETALLLWQAPLPAGDDARLVNELIDRGGRIIFFPPRSPSNAAMFGVGWDAWVEADPPLAVETWRGDQDLWEHAASGAALTIGKLAIRRYCRLTGATTTLARLADGSPLLARVATDRGGVYFCSTTVRPEESSLAAEGVALYVAVQRAVEAGVETLGTARLVDAGAGQIQDNDASAWRQLAGNGLALSTEYVLTRGAYADHDRLWAVNRPAAEDGPETVDDERIAGLFAGLDFRRVSSAAGETDSLVSEVWRTFLTAMLIALVGEASLCLPRRAAEAPAAA
ncbi:BatA domain-containing protein [Pirellulales bacterium]|nr:BatA domain-containing protein [Pirellulales bacterium]